MRIFMNAFALVLVLFLGWVYYKLATSNNPKYIKLAFVLKITFLSLSFILAFIKSDFIVIGRFALGGRTSVMTLILFEIADSFIEKKKDK